MIPVLAMVIALSGQTHLQTQPVARDASVQVASSDGRLKNPKKFYEVPQSAQDDAEFAPPVGRMPDPDVSPTSPVRYHTAEEMALPVIVRPTPRYVKADDPKADPNAPKPIEINGATDANKPGQPVVPTATAFGGSAGVAPTQATADVLTPNPQATSPTDAYSAAQKAATTESMSLPPAGSATGSTATVKYN